MVVELYESLIQYITTVRTMYDEFEKSAKEMFQDDEVIPDYIHKNRKRKKQYDDSNKPDIQFDGRQNFKINTFNL